MNNFFRPDMYNFGFSDKNADINSLYRNMDFLTEDLFTPTKYSKNEFINKFSEFLGLTGNIVSDLEVSYFNSNNKFQSKNILRNNSGLDIRLSTDNISISDGSNFVDYFLDDKYIYSFRAANIVRISFDSTNNEYIIIKKNK